MMAQLQKKTRFHQVYSTIRTFLNEISKFKKPLFTITFIIFLWDQRFCESKMWHSLLWLQCSWLYSMHTLWQVHVLILFFNIGNECIIPCLMDYVSTSIASCVQHTSTHTHLHTPTALTQGISLTAIFPHNKQLVHQSFVLFELTHTGVVAMKRPSANRLDKEDEEEETKTEDMAEEPEKTEEDEKEKQKTPVKAKAKAKNKAKSKAKSKAKAKPKTAPKQKKEKEMKEKKGKKEKNAEEEEAPEKENLNDKCEKWKAAVDGRRDTRSKRRF